MKITIDGIIGLDVDDKSVREQLKEADGADVVVEIASPGGLISEGLKIYNTLKNYDGKVDTHLVGSVASMATYVAMAGERRTAEKNAVFMIHNGRALAVGDHNDMFRVGRHLEALTNIAAKEYSIKSGTPLDDIRAAMDAETFYYGDEIKKAGFVHEITGDIEPENRSDAVAFAALMVQECQEKINTPESIKKDITALSMMIKAPTGAQHKTKKEGMNMEITMELLAKDAPDLLAKIQTDAKASGYEAGIEAGVKQERERVSALLSIEDADAETKATAIKDGVSVEASYKLFYEAEKGKKAADLAALNETTPGSVGQQGKQAGEDGDAKTFMAAVDEYQKTQGCTRTDALKAVAKANPELHAAFLTGGK